MRGVAHQRDPPVGVTLCQGQVQRIAEPPARQPDRPEEIAKAGAQNLKKLRVVQRRDGGRRLRPFAPHDRGSVAGQRQDRQRAGGHEELMRGAVMGQVVFDGADQRRLAIVPARPPDPGPLGGARLATVATGKNAAPDLATVG